MKNIKYLIGKTLIVILSAILTLTCIACGNNNVALKNEALKIDEGLYQGPRSYQYERDFINYPQRWNAVYSYTSDEALRLHEGYYRPIYDRITDSIVLYDEYKRTAYIYNAETAELIRTFGAEFSTQFAINDGRILKITNRYSGLAGEPNTVTFTVYDLLSGNEIIKREISGKDLTAFSPFALIGDIAVYTASYNTPPTFFNLQTGESYVADRLLGENYLTDCDRNILYSVTDQGYYGSKSLRYIDVLNGKTIFSVTDNAVGDFDVQGFKLIGDGVSFQGKIYDPINGNLLSDTLLLKKYGTLVGFTPQQTLYSDRQYDIVAGYNEEFYELALYSNTTNKYIYRADGGYYKAESKGDGVYFLQSNVGCARLDTKKISGEIQGNLSDLLTLETAQGEKTTKFTFIKKYADTAIDNGLLYFALDDTVSIFDASSFAHVKTLNFTNRIRCIDAYEGYLAVGFGALVLEFALVSVKEWNIRYVQTESDDLFIGNCGAEVISVYNDRVYYVGLQYWDSIHYYDIKTHKSSAVGNHSIYSSPYFTIDKKSGILYVAPTGSSSSEITYIDLSRNRLLYEAQFNEYSYNDLPAVFDGTYVHFYGYILDAKTGIRVFDRDRLFPSDPAYEFLGNIYFDNRISVSVAKHDEKIVTVVYDTQNKKMAVTAGDAERAIPFGKGFFIIRPNRDTMYYVEL